jgi:aspartyl protease family protein
MRPGAAAALACVGLALAAPVAQAQGVVLAGRMGDRALLVIDGQAHTLAVGARAAGVRLLRWNGDEAELELAGRRLLARIGAAPAQVGGAGSGGGAREVVIPAGSGGHFVAAGAINGRATRFMVDTGATVVALGRAEADRLGLDLRQARTATMQTANGPVPVQMVVLTQVRLGDVELAHVDAAVLPLPMPYVLLGNSFLSRFQMRRDNDVMRLELR